MGVADISALDSAQMTKPIAASAAILFAALNVLPQTTAPPVVEVASIKEMSRRDFRYAGLTGCPLSTPKVSGNRISITGATVCTLIRTAYSLEEFEISGAPDWTTKGGDLLAYDIQALVEGSEVLTLERGRQLLQTVLSQRFKLEFHKETRDLDVLVLLVDKDGAKLTEAPPPGCSGRGDNVGSWFRTSPAPDGKFGERVGGFTTCKKAPLAALARSLTLYLLDNVVDRTGLKGEFTWELWWSDRSELASE